jgi:hypothetical protein
MLENDHGSAGAQSGGGPQEQFARARDEFHVRLREAWPSQDAEQAVTKAYAVYEAILQEPWQSIELNKRLAEALEPRIPWTRTPRRNRAGYVLGRRCGGRSFRCSPPVRQPEELTVIKLCRAKSSKDYNPEDLESNTQPGHRMPDDIIEDLRTLRDKPVWPPIPEHVRKVPVCSLTSRARRPQAAYEDFSRIFVRTTRKWPSAILG